jgi:putative transposase
MRHAAGETVAGCIVHSDLGSHFVSRNLRRALTAQGLVGSMGRVASAGDNAAMESFFSLLQNVLDPQTWATLEDRPNRDRDLDRADLSPPP